MALKKGIFILLILLLVIGLGLVIYKPLLVLRLQAKAGEIMTSYLNSAAGDYRDHFVCLIPLLVDLPEAPDLQIAIDLLKEAQQLQPDQPQAYFLLGQAACLNHQYQMASEVLLRYTELKPNNLLGKLEAAFSFIGYGLRADTLEVEARKSIFNQAILLLEDSGYSQTTFKALAEETFGVGAYREAWIWYTLSSQFAPLEADMFFRQRLLDSVFQSQDAQFDQDVIQWKVPDRPVIIPPSAFFRLEDGESVAIREKGGLAAGVYSSQFDPGGVFISLPEKGLYCFQVHVFDAPPTPIQIELSVDFSSSFVMEVSNGNAAWQVLTESFLLESGRHLISLHFLNDLYRDDMDRNAYLGEIQIYLCE